MILVTQKQVLELYISAIERKTLYSLHVPHTAFPNAAKATTTETTNATTNEVHVTKDGDIGTSHLYLGLNKYGIRSKFLVFMERASNPSELNYVLIRGTQLSRNHRKLSAI